MPFINSKITFPVDDAKKEVIQSKLTDFVTDSLTKPKNFVMVNIEDNQQIWFAGKKLQNGVFVSVRLMGNASKAAYSNLTKKICDFFESELNISSENIYVTFHPVEFWGWNSSIL